MVSLSNVQLRLRHEPAHLFDRQFRSERKRSRLQGRFYLVIIQLPKKSLLSIFKFFLFCFSRNGTIATLLKNQFPISQFQTGEFSVPGFDLQVVDTDYNNYILWHACITDLKTGAQFERVVVATRSLDEVSHRQDERFDSLIAKKIFNNTKPVSIPPYGRCNCDKI